MAQPAKRWSAKVASSFIVAVSEMDEWLNDRRTYDDKHAQGWKSTTADFHSSADHVGPKLRQALSAELSVALSDTRGLPANLPTRKGPALVSLRQLRKRLTSPIARDAAWQDVVDACQDPALAYEIVAARRDLFWQIIQAADYNVDRLSSLLGGVLDNRSYDVILARITLGDIGLNEVEWPQRPQEPAGLDEDERLSLCHRLLTTPPSTAHHIVWVAFEKCSLNRAVHDVGPVTFYEAQSVRANLAQDGANRAHLPSELLTGGAFFDYKDLPEGNDIVLARVDLGKGAFTDPIRQAREQAEAIVALASFRIGERRWRLLRGHLYAANGRIEALEFFSAPSDDPGNLAFSDTMGTELDRLATDLASQLPISDPNLTETIDAVRWWQEAKTQPPLPAVILNVRVLELIATRVTNSNKSWYEYLKSYLANAWVREKIISTLHKVAFEAVHNTMGMVSRQQYEKIDEFRNLIFSSRPGGHTADLRKALGILPDLATIYPDHDPLSRRIHTLASCLSSPLAVAAWADDLEAQWKLVVPRLQRIRNALAHGGPLDLASAETVYDFSTQLASWALSLSLQGILDGRGMLAAHDNLRAQAISWRSSITSVSSTEEALFVTGM